MQATQETQRRAPRRKTSARLSESPRYREYRDGDDTEQYEKIRGKLSTLNWILSDKALDDALTCEKKDYGKLVQLCTALGITFDKTFGKREVSVKPVSMPPPLIAMVRKALTPQIDSLHNGRYQTLTSQPMTSTSNMASEGHGGVACAGLTGLGGGGSPLPSPPASKVENIENNEKDVSCQIVDGAQVEHEGA